ncbi:hypothetical protein L873DRAFT_1800293 [Choiromyces venosus 120613-1]|uniref:Uncharacterized protein n=1 Tax=Choiromyces venosus 120613-1 TaxID=1336337 RepID=A0A3N4JZK7_9PEZI|nr:hypothetical protein L873DRAFT_1800293 [Choiromyces venosus 120613-1]
MLHEACPLMLEGLFQVSTNTLILAPVPMQTQLPGDSIAGRVLSLKQPLFTKLSSHILKRRLPTSSRTSEMGFKEPTSG